MEWYPDGEKFLTATTAPRLRIGNGFKVWHYSGALLHETAWPAGQELYQVIWQKYPDNVFKEKPISNVKVQGIEPSQPVSSKAVYVPPNIRSGSGIPIGTSSRGGAPDRGPIPGLPIGYKVSQGQRKKDRNAKKKEADGAKLNSDSSINPILRSGSKTQANANDEETQAQNRKRNARRSPRQPNNQNHTNGNGTSSHSIIDSNTNFNANVNANESSSVEQASFDSIDSQDKSKRERRPRNRQRKPDGVTATTGDPEKEKRMRTVQQKLRDITKLKARRENGENLEANQLSKISSETELIKELNALKVDS